MAILLARLPAVPADHAAPAKHPQPSVAVDCGLYKQSSTLTIVMTRMSPNYNLHYLQIINEVKLGLKLCVPMMHRDQLGRQNPCNSNVPAGLRSDHHKSGYQMPGGRPAHPAEAESCASMSTLELQAQSAPLQLLRPATPHIQPVFK